MERDVVLVEPARWAGVSESVVHSRSEWTTILPHMTDFGFAQPLALLLLPAAPLLVWWLLRRRRPALRYSDVSLLAGVPSSGARGAKWGGAVLRGLAVLLTILAVANFRISDLKTRL